MREPSVRSAILPQTPQAAEFVGHDLAWVMSGLMLAMFLGFLDQTIVATALSSVAREFDDWRLASWVVSGYLVASTVATPIYGRLSDIHGRRPLLLAALGVFVSASVWCALAIDIQQLIVARVLQGLGGGGLWSVSHAVVADIIPPRERGRYQGYFSSVLALANVLGPVLGGSLAEHLSWRWIFWINVPLGVAAFLLSNRHLSRLRAPGHRHGVDWIGAALILASVTPILIGVTFATRRGGWLSVDVLALLALGGILLLGLILWERVVPEPMLPLRLFRNSIFATASVITFLALMVMIALLVLVPLNYQFVAGLSPTTTGIRMLPVSVGTVLGSFIAGQLVSRTGRYRTIIIAGAAVAALTCVTIARAGLGQTLAFDVGATAILGLGFGCLLSPITIVVQNAIDTRDTGIGMSCLMFFRLIGGALGVAIFGTILFASLTNSGLDIPGHELLGADPSFALTHLGPQDPGVAPELLASLSDAIRQAFSYVFTIAGIILFGGVIGAMRLKEIPLRSRNVG